MVNRKIIRTWLHFVLHSFLMTQQKSPSPKSFLFVCTGNICRSPTAEGLFERTLAEAGLTGRFAHDIGHAPDARSQATAAALGTPLHHLRARNVRPSDFTAFDVILAMDETHLKALQRMQPAGSTALLSLHLAYCGITERPDVPDPYFGQQADFDYVYEVLNRANAGLMKRLKPTN
jgi:protein-tyrosine phosphatase